VVQAVLREHLDQTEAQVADVVVRSISGHLKAQMQQHYSTARGHEQEAAIARIIDLTRLTQRARGNTGSVVDTTSRARERAA
jgi:hypothetical protein